MKNLILALTAANVSTRTMNVICGIATECPHLMPYLSHVDIIIMAEGGDKAEWIRNRATMAMDADGE
jgi:hypothetical protein